MRYVQTQEDLEELVGELSTNSLFALDSEAAGFHRYSDRICLIQVSTREETYLIDTLAVTDPAPLGPLLADADTEVILHDADFDLRLLDRDFNMMIRGLFDTQIAARFLGMHAIGLADLLESHLGVSLEKKYQRADWARRPLPEGMIRYAAEDTRHLPELRDRLRDELRERGREKWAEEEFRDREGTHWDEDDEAPFRKLKGAGRLDPRSLAALRELYQWRDGQARQKDRAPFRIMSNKALMEAAKSLPRSAEELADVKGMSGKWVRKYGGELLGAVRRAREMEEDRLPRKAPRAERPPRDIEAERRAERLRTARTEAAHALRLDSGFLLPRSLAEEIARRNPTTPEELAAVPGVREWQVEAAGDRFLTALRD